MTKFKELLRSIGLTDSEVSVYSQLLEVKKATVSELMKRLSLHRPNIYEALLRLVKKGLVSNNSKDYHINDAEKLLDYIEVMRSELQDKKDLIANLLPEPIEEECKPKVSVFEGYKALKSVFEEMLRITDCNHCIGAWDYPYIMEWFFKNWHLRRVQEGFNDKMIFNESGRERGEELSKLPYSEVRFLDKHAHSPAAINVYANKVFIIIGSKTNPIGILIEDEGVSRDFLAYFNVLWENTTK